MILKRKLKQKKI